MSISVNRALPCLACGAAIEGLTYESANPARHPPLRESLLDRTFLKLSCPACGTVHEHFSRFVWTDIPGKLCACVVAEAERESWPILEAGARDSLAAPLRAEGPSVVRDWGERVDLRLFFGLEELREKVVCRLHGLDDRLVEALKLTALDTAVRGAPILDAATNGERLSYRFLGTPAVASVPWASYAAATDDRPALARQFPGLFSPASTWIHWRRAERPPLGG